MGRVPRKAAYLAFETDPAFHFDYFLAEMLHLTVGQVRAMPMTEWIGWGVYVARKAQARQLADERRR